MAEEKDLRAEEEQDGAQLENDAQDAVSEEAESEDTGISGGGKMKQSGKSITAIVLNLLLRDAPDPDEEKPLFSGKKDA